MGDFLLDFRQRSQRQLVQVGEDLRFVKHTHIVIIDEDLFGLVVALTDDSNLWSPYRDEDGTLVVIAGRVVLDEQQWAEGEALLRPGGLASKAIFQQYQSHGIKGLERLSGNYVLLVYDTRRNQIHLITDCGGAFPAYRLDSNETLLFSSHPDVLAKAADERDCLDELSMAEFVLASAVTPPFTYYKKIRAIDQGTVTTIQLQESGQHSQISRPYFEIKYQPQEGISEQDLAEELASTFRKAVRRRTLRRLGLTAVGLSGGLDSRAILSCIENKDLTHAFFCYNEPNYEFRIASAIAKTLGIEFIPWHRDFEYYGDNSELGIKISGGMGTFANNHFLGILGHLRATGAQNLLTGCYCDYLFKGLPLNRSRHWLTGREQLAPFQHQFYFTHYGGSTRLARQARERWETRIPSALRSSRSEEAVFQIEALRTFPLCYEPDNQQRVVPQRTSGWYPPVADRDILEIYCKIPYIWKMNRSLFKKTVIALCGPELASIPDTNTGAKIGASTWVEVMSTNFLRARRKLRQLRRSIATDESWPNWHYYVRRSKKLAELWKRPNPDAFELFRCILGRERVKEDIAEYQDNDLFQFVSLLTLKLWLEQR